MLGRRTKFVATIIAPTLALAAIIQLWGYVSSGSEKPRHERYADLPTLPSAQARTSRAIGPGRTVLELSEVFTANVAVNGSWLLIASLHSDQAVVAIDIPSGKVYDLSLQLRGKLGTSYTFLSSGARRGSFVLSSIKDVPLLEIVLGDPAAAPDDVVVRRIHRGPDWEFSVEMRDGQWLSTSAWHQGYVSTGRVVDGRLVQTKDVGQSIFTDVASPNVLLMLNRSRVAVAPNRERLAQAYLMSCRIQIVTADGTLERQVAGPIDLKLEYDIYLDKADSQEKMAPNARMKFCYTGVAASDAGVFALFAGNAFKEFQNKMSYGKQLHLFSWDGRPQGVWELHDHVQSIAVSAAGDRLWAISPERKALVEYSIGPQNVTASAQPAHSHTVASQP